MNLSELNIDEDAFDIFVTFNASNKIEFLSDALEFGTQSAILKQMEKITEEVTSHALLSIVSSQDFISNGYRLCVTTLDGEVQLNSESLKSIRKFVTKLFYDGVILTPLKKKKTEMDMYRYFKAYKVIGRANPISLS